MASFNTDLRSAMTQVFKVAAPAAVPGIYATKVDLFFRRKSNSFGIEVQIVELTNGLPDSSKVLPNATAIVNPASINLSETGVTATTITFPQPVYLYADQRYALVVRALGNSPDYEIWTGVQGGVDLATGKSISSNPLSEDAYFAKNAQALAVIPNEDLKYKIYRAKFNIANTSTAILKKAPTELLSLKYFAPTSGEFDVRAGDEVFGVAAGVANTQIKAKVVKYDRNNNYLYLSQSTGLFAANAGIMIVRTGAEANVASAKSGLLGVGVIDTIVDFDAHGVALKVGSPNKSFATTNFEYKGAYKEGDPLVPVLETEFRSITNQNEIDFQDQPRYMLSRSTEVSNLAGNSSVTIQATLTSNSNFVSPIIDLRERYIIGLRNLLNSDVTGEDGDYGAAKSRYISKTITLADAADGDSNAEDLRVFVTAYKPPRTRVLAYCKLWNPEDSDDFDLKKWTLMTQTTDANLFSDPKNAEDYREYQFDLPETAPVAGAAYSPYVDDPVDGDPVRYETENGLFIGFKKFAIKLVMAVDNDTDAFNYPRINDLRAIALQR